MTRDCLIVAGAPLDHVNNLGWTALIESIVLGDGGERHTDTLRALVEAGAFLLARRSLGKRAGLGFLAGKLRVGADQRGLLLLAIEPSCATT